MGEKVLEIIVKSVGPLHYPPLPLIFALTRHNYVQTEQFHLPVGLEEAKKDAPGERPSVAACCLLRS